jgi:hypothetical protein
MLAIASQVMAGDSIFLQSAGSVNPGLWALGVNNNTPGAYLPANPFSGGYTFFNDGNLTPQPNKPLVGDINGDGVADLVTVGDNTYQDLFFGRNTATVGTNGNLSAAPVGSVGWPNNFVGTDIASSDHFVADINGDGKADVVTRKAAWSGTSFWEARNSSATGIGTTTNTWAAGVGTYANKALMGDFNGDGSADIAEQNMSSGLVAGIRSTSGVGLNDANPIFWGGMGLAANHIATLVGDINGDGKDDIVQVDNRSSNGAWTWVAGLTGVNGGIPAGIEIAQGGATSWVSPFTLDAASTKAVPLLADLNGDGRDDLVLYEEYLDATSGNIWSRILASYTDGTGLFGNGFDEAVWYNWVGMTGAAYSNLVPLVGNVTIPEPATMLLLSLGGLLLRKKTR